MQPCAITKIRMGQNITFSHMHGLRPDLLEKGVGEVFRKTKQNAGGQRSIKAGHLPRITVVGKAEAEPAGKGRKYETPQKRAEPEVHQIQTPNVHHGVTRGFFRPPNKPSTRGLELAKCRKLAKKIRSYTNSECSNAAKNC